MEPDISGMDDDELAPADLACLDLDGNGVYVLIGGVTTCEHGSRREFITIAVRDSDSDDEIINRAEYREVINVEPVDAIRLARFLLDYATDMLDADDDQDDQPEGIEK